MDLTVTGRKLPLSDAFKARNPELFGPGRLGAPVSPKQAPALERHPSPQQSRQIRLDVCLIGFRRRLLDDDNFTAGCKPLRDAIAADLGLDDADPSLHFTYAQIQSDHPATAVKIDATFL